MQLSTREQKVIHTGLQVMANLLKRYAMDEERTIQSLKQAGVWDEKNSPILIKGAKLGIAKNVL